MAQTNYTPISLYYSTTASAVPTAANLVPGELAINTNDGKLYYEDSSGVVQVLATKSTGSIGGSNTQVQFNNSGSLGGSSGLTWDGSFLTTSSIKNSALTSGRVTYAGASGLLQDSSVFIYDTNGNLGVGTNNTGFGASGATRILNLRAGTTAGTSSLTFGDSNAVGYIESINGNGILNINAGNYIQFGAGSSERMRITSAGNVGIGTSSPLLTASGRGNLTINGSSNSILVLANGGDTSGYIFGDASSLGISAGAGTNSRVITFDTNGITRLTLDTSGNLGLGVTPAAWAGTGVKAFQFQNGSLAASNTFATNLAWNAIYDGSYKYVSNSTAGLYQLGGSHSWSVAPSGTAGNAISFTQAMTLDASGNLLLGTTSVLGSSNGAILSVKALGASNTYFATVMQDSSSNNLFSVRSDGYFNTGVGSLSPYNNTTASVANVYVDSSGFLYRGTSSLKYKTNVQTATFGLADVLKLRPVTYQSKTEKDTKKIFGGLIAEEVDESGLKIFVDYAEDGTPDALHYASMVSLCIKAIQEQQALIESLTTRLTALESK